MKDCERCGGEVSWTKDTVQLVGGVSASLCNPCLREFNDVFYGSEEYAESLLVSAQEAHYEAMAHAQQPVFREAWEDLARRIGEKDKAFAALSNRFLATVPAHIK